MAERMDCIYRAAWLHFGQGLQQKEVAERLGVDKATVSRWIAAAVEKRIVSIELEPPGLSELQVQLASLFDLSVTRVIPSLPDPPSSGRDDGQAREHGLLLSEELGKAAAELIGSRLRGGTGVGLGGGRGGDAFARHLWRHCPVVGLDFFALAVSSREPFELCATSVTAICVSLIQSEFRRRASRNHRDGKFSTPKVEGHALRLPDRGADPKAVSEAAEAYYERAMEKVEVVVTGVGEIKNCWILSEDERNRFEKERGAIGDIVYDLFGENGTPICVDPAAAVYPFGISRLRRLVSSYKQGSTQKKEVIVISAGKTEALYHALISKERFVSGLVTDEKTAERLVQMHEAAASQRGDLHPRRRQLSSSHRRPTT